MNLVGKIFTVLICVLSLVFMTLAMIVYATHKNWRKVVLNPPDEATFTDPKGLKYVWEDEKAHNEELSQQLDDLKRAYEAELKTKTDRLTTLEDELSELKQERTQREQEKAEQTEKLRRAIAAMKAAQEESNNFFKEAKGLRSDIEKAHQDRELHLERVDELTGELHDLQNDLKNLKNSELTLAADLAKAQQVLRHFNMSKDTDISGIPPLVDGRVLSVQGDGLLEISLGSDDGLMKGHKLELVRPGPTGSKYVGRVEVVRVSADRAVCQIDPNYHKRDVQVDDRVYSKLN